MSKILLVDDSALTRNAISRLLAGMQYAVSTAQSGKTAWTMLYEDLPDVIVLDLMMPEMGGVTFLRMLRSHHHWRELPVVVLTGLESDEALVEAAKELGVDDVVQKGPNCLDLLLRRIDQRVSPGQTERIGSERTRSRGHTHRHLGRA